MIILDTNVISELVRTAPEPRVLDWLRPIPLAELATTTINIAEIRQGLARLSTGHRRRDLELRLGSLLSNGFANRVFAFDAPAADIYGEIVVARERIGRRLEGFDGLIAAIARSLGLAVATRNERDFDACGIEIFNPWQATPQ
jgi:toxin FitB